MTNSQSPQISRSRSTPRVFSAAGALFSILTGLLLGSGAQAASLQPPEDAIWSVTTPDSAKMFEHLQRGTFGDLLRLPLIDYALSAESPGDPMQPLIKALAPLVSEGESVLRSPFAGPALLFAVEDPEVGQVIAAVLGVNDRLLIHRYVQRALPRLRGEYPIQQQQRLGSVEVHLLGRPDRYVEAFTNPFTESNSWWEPTWGEPGQLLKQFNTLAIAIKDNSLIVSTSMTGMRAALNLSSSGLQKSVSAEQVDAASAQPAWLAIDIDIQRLLESQRGSNASIAQAAQKSLGLDRLTRLSAYVREGSTATGLTARLDIELHWSKRPAGLLGAVEFADSEPPRAADLPRDTLVYLGLNSAEQVTFESLGEALTQIAPGLSAPALIPPGLQNLNPENPLNLSELLRPRGAAALSIDSDAKTQLGLWIEQSQPQACAALVSAWNTLQSGSDGTASTAQVDASGEWLSLIWGGETQTGGSLHENPRFSAVMSAVGTKVGLLWFDDQAARLQHALRIIERSDSAGQSEALLLGSAGMTAMDLEKAKAQLEQRGALAWAVTLKEHGLRITSLRTVAEPQLMIETSAAQAEPTANQANTAKIDSANPSAASSPASLAP